MKFLMAKKIGMTQIFDQEGIVTPVTVLEAGPCVITQIKTAQKDGYNALQIGFGEAKKQAKPLLGHLKKAKTSSRYLAEIKIIDNQDFWPEESNKVEASGQKFSVGDKLDCTVFKVGDRVKVSAISKGKGFAGTIKRHNFHRGPKTHGSHNYRKPGSIGSAFPQHVFKGQKMAGQMGNKKVTVRNLQIVKIDSPNNLILVKGAVPGPKNGLVKISGIR